jgi:hypothetical protein
MWEWTVPETGFTVTAPDWPALVEASRIHYAANGFTYGKALETRIQTVIGDRLKSQGIKGYCYDETTVPEFVLTLKDSKGEALAQRPDLIHKSLSL